MNDNEAKSVVEAMCGKYSGAVNASDADAYSKLFTDDAIWMPPGGLIRKGPDEIRAAEGADYEETELSVGFTAGDALEIADGWIYGIAHVIGTATRNADGNERSFKFTVTWLLNEQAETEWKIKRQMWNHKPA
jgi:uncharacterized protein (TIGR02246 family)